MSDSVIAPIAQLRPVAFDNARPQDGLTHGQISIVAMLKQALVDNTQINREAITKAYISACHGGAETYCKAYRRQDGDYDYKSVKVSIESRNIRSKAIQWFKLNLGSCIIKGRVLALPVIDIDA